MPERDETRINERIRVPQVRLVGEDGNQIGVVDTQQALRYAQERDLDLVEVAPEARPPVMPRARLLEVQVRAGAEGEGRAAPPEAGERPRDQAAPEDRDQRLRDQEEPRGPLPEGRRPREGHDHVPRPRADPSGARRAPPDAARRGRRRPGHDRAVAPAGRPQHDDAPGSHEAEARGGGDFRGGGRLPQRRTTPAADGTPAAETPSMLSFASSLHSR